jgi:hypothetical protein
MGAVEASGTRNISRSEMVAEADLFESQALCVCKIIFNGCRFVGTDGEIRVNMKVVFNLHGNSPFPILDYP